MKFFLITYFLILTASNAISISPDTTYVKNVYDRAWGYIDIGEDQKAIPLLEEILRIKKDDSLDFKPKFFKLYNTLGVLYRRQGSIATAIEYYSRAIETKADKNSKSIVYNNLGGLYALQGEYSKAISYYGFALSELGNTPNENAKRVIDIYHNLGFAYYKVGQWEKSLYYYQRSIDKTKENHISELGDTYYNAGLFCQSLRKYDEANRYYLLSIQSYTNEYGPKHYKTAMSYINYAQYFNELNDYTNSSKYYKKGYQTLLNTVGLKHPYTSYCLLGMGNLLSHRENYLNALQSYQRSIIAKVYTFNDTSILANPSKDIFPSIELIEILKAKGKALTEFSKQQNSSSYLLAALEAYRLTAGYIEKLRMGYSYESSKLQISSHEHEVFTAIVTLAYQLYLQTNDEVYKSLAFEFAERGKYGVLRQLQSENMARSRTGIPDSVTSRELRIKERISSLQYTLDEESKLERPSTDKLEKLNAELFGLVRESEQLVKDIESNYPEYYKQKYSNQVVSLPQLQQAMEKKEAVLEYVLGDKELYTFAITKDTFQLVRQEADTTFLRQLNFLIYAMRSFYSTGYYKYRDAAYTLYKKLIYPVEPLLKGKNLLIIPDGKLGLISFDVLTDRPYQEGDRRDYVHEPYLLMKYPIGYAYSATLYSNSLNCTHKGSPDFLGIAPDYKTSKDSLRSIPIGLQSVRKIALLTFGKSLTGSNATEENFRKYSNSYGIIHFYAHGFEDTLNPANSKLVLSTPTDSTDDDYLHAWEVYNMQLNAEMVVLGSCFSGSGKLSEGEGVLSISRSFMYAGSKSVVMSLWAAADRSTNNILNDFYLNLLKGMRKDEALRLAKLKNLEMVEPISAHPRYWAGIVVNGSQNALYHYWILKKVILIVTIIIVLFLLVWKRRAIKILLGADTSRYGDAGRS
ncbi:MAG: CHAT domain-containing protein [Bacteroidales bacterium]|nr:CHAT domain-containing protein [Bacteroidales bacterium]